MKTLFNGRKLGLRLIGLLITGVCITQFQIANAAIPTAPSNLVAQRVSGSQANLTWNDNSNNETGFKIERAINTGGFSQIATTTSASYNNTGLSPRTTYKYRVRAYNSSGNSAYTNTATTSTGPSFFLDISASSNGSGTQTSPWNTVASVNNFTFIPGDSIYVKRGTTVTGTPTVRKSSTSLAGLLTPLGSGSPAGQITLDVYGTGAAPIIDAQGATNTAAILLYNQQYWNIQNLEARNNSTTYALRWGIKVYSDNGTIINGINIKNNTIRNIYGSMGGSKYETGGIHIKVEEPGRMNGLLIQGNQVYDVRSMGICFWGEMEQYDIYNNLIPGSMNWNNLSPNVIIRGNTIRRTGGDGILMLGTDNELIESNLVDSAGWLGNMALGPLCGLWPTRHRNGIIQFNEVSHTKIWTGDGQAMENDVFLSGITVFQYNYTHNNDDCAFTECGPYYSSTYYPDDIGNPHSIFRYNISVNDGGVLPQRGYLYETRDGVEIYNNVFYTTFPVTVLTDANGAFKNNIFLLGNGSSIQNGIYTDDKGQTHPGPIYSNNCFWSSNGGSLTIPTQNNTSPVQADPRFIDPVGSGTMGFKLQLSSPCIHAGIPVVNNGGIDFWRCLISTGTPNIGACEQPNTVPIYRLMKPN